MERFLTVYNNIGRDRSQITVQTQDDINENKTTASAAAPAPSSTTSTNNNNTTSLFPQPPAAAPVAPTATGNLFSGVPNSSAPAPAFNFGGSSTTTTTPAPAPASGFSGFSFNPTPASAPAQPATATDFSFGTKTATPEVRAAAEAPVDATRDASAGEENDQDNVKTVLGTGADDEKYNIKFQGNVKVMKMVNDKWSNVAIGTLKIQQNKETGKCLAIVRDSTTGLAKFTVGIQKDTMLQPLRWQTTKQTPTKPSKKFGNVIFVGLASEETDAKPYNFKVGESQAQELHDCISNFKSS